MIFYLDDDNIDFPDPSLAEDDGLLAIGGDLSSNRLINAYLHGIFPWFSEGDPICWFSPHERCVIFPDKIYVSRSMKRLLRSKHYQITSNQDFSSVIDNCAAIHRPGQDGTWITAEMKKAYKELHNIGVAQSIEVWDHQQELAGGIYGVKVGSVFCGESMFSKEANASKAALIWLCQNTDISLIDCQLPNPHLLSLGAEMINQRAFLNILPGKHGPDHH